MHLTREEERMYDGEHGWACQVCMRILVRLGELFGAERLIPIHSAHVSGVSYKTLGDAPTEFLEAALKEGGKARVLSTLNPSSVEESYLAKKLPRGFQEKQRAILEIFEAMGINLSLTCTPYYQYEPPRDVHLAWSESSAVVYANSVLGAWTNREGGPSALAAALIGKTPDYGMHKPENRRPNVVVDVLANPRNEVEFGALGYYIGKTLKDEVPLFKHLRAPSLDSLKQLGAAMAASGMTSIFHFEERLEKEKLERFSVERKELEETVRELSTFTAEKPDLVFLGCPHCSLKEIKNIARLLEGKKVRSGVEFWVCVSRYVKEKARNYVRVIEAAGGRVLCDTCAIVTWTSKLGVNSILTNSAKAAHYAPTMNKAEVALAPMKECVRLACSS